jgi:hypothetical protein
LDVEPLRVVVVVVVGDDVVAVEVARGAARVVPVGCLCGGRFVA